MITACKSYITIRGTQTVWTQPQNDVIEKLKDSIKLNQEYQNCFQRTKEKLAQMPNEKPFDFSEMYIFGKFDTFTKRCQKIIDIFNTFNAYSTLQESKIEGKKINLNVFIIVKFFFFVFFKELNYWLQN